MFVCLTALVYMVLHHRTDKTQSKLFIVIIVNILVGAICSSAAEIVNSYGFTSESAHMVSMVSNYFYFVVHTALGPLLLLYVAYVCGSEPRFTSPRSQLAAIPFYLTELLALTNPLTNFLYSYDANFTYTREWGMTVLYVVGALYLIVAFVLLIFRWNAVTPLKRRALLFFFVMAGIGILVQMLNRAIRLELFMESIALLGVMMFVESEEDVIDSMCGIYNREGLRVDLDRYERRTSSYSIIALRVTNADMLARVGGTRAAEAMTIAVSDYLKTLMPWYRVYRTSPARFILVDPHLTAKDASAIAHKIAERFQGTWDYNDTTVDLRAVVVHARVPEDLATSGDVFYLNDTPVPTVKDKLVLEGDDLNYLIRRADVERAVQNGFETNGYEVYYQPIFGADGKPHSAEALMRLTDAELGPVPPYEFIEAAERIGAIERIGDFAMNEVCAFLASGVPSKIGIERISVNLSMIQCMRAGFTTHMEGIVDSYGVSKNAVVYEITESMAAGDYEFLGGIMRRLHGVGHLFAMDDYGTGYSNMHSLISLDFDTVKIDKSILWDAEKSEVGKVLLEHSVNMMRQVGSAVLVEGVETESQVELLRALGVDFYQGFFFARPMPKREFIEFCSRYV